MKKIVILVHGGAGKRRVSRKGLKTLRDALEEGFSILKKGGRSMDAVERAIRILEDDEEFNAGTGSRLQLDGVARIDASIMDGKTLQAGAVSSIEGIRNPISGARFVLERSPHVLMVGDRAREFLISNGIEVSDVITDTSQDELKKNLKKSEEIIELFQDTFVNVPEGGETVGAVALDHEKNLAAGSSTGGSTLMLPGRVGDTPIIGSGIYADNSIGAVSATGIGESIIRIVLAREICYHMEKGESPRFASRKSIEKMAKKVGGVAGVITLRWDGRYALVHNSPYMSGGVCAGGKKPLADYRFTS